MSIVKTNKVRARKHIVVARAQFVLKKFAQKIKAYKQSMMKIISKQGRAIQGVNGDDSNLPYLYTIGNTGAGIPEILVSGSTSKTLANLMNLLSQKMLDSPEFTQENYQRLLDEVLEERDYCVIIDDEPQRSRIKIKLLDWMKTREEVILSVDRYGFKTADVKLIQLVCSDRFNVLPDEPNYDVAGFPQNVYGN